MLKKPSAYSPLYSPLDSLVDLACRDGVDVRPTLLRVITDLYVQKPTHTVEEVTQYVELALGLIDAVDAPTRIAVSMRLSNYGAAPVAVLQRLAASIPQDTATTPTITLAAEEKTSAAPAPVVATQPAATATLSASPPAQNLVTLFFAAPAEERRLILTNLEARPEPALPQPGPLADDLIQALESSALRHDTVEFSRLLERSLAIAPELAELIVDDLSGEPILVAAKALGMPADVLQRILLFLNPSIGQSVKHVFRLAQLYEDIAPASAARMVAIWRQTGTGARPKHAPVHWNDETTGARARATPGRHRVSRPAPAQYPRHRFGLR